MGISLTPEEQLEVFGTDRLAEWDQEASERWGQTDAYRESRRRAAAYAKADWVEIQHQAAANLQAFRDAFTAGEPAVGPRATELAEAHRQHICRWFYDCGYALHRGLAELYITDPRFAGHYDRLAPGLARYVHDAVLANADRGA